MAVPVLELTEAFRALGTPQGRQDPYPLYEAIRAHGDRAWLRKDRLVVVGYDACARALRDPLLHVQDGAAYDVARPGWRAHSSLRGFTDSMLYSNAAAHSRQRGIVSFAFTPPRVRQLDTVIGEMAERLLERMALLGRDGAPVDVVAEFASRLPIAVISTMLGFPEEDQVWFRDMASAIAVSTDGFTGPGALSRADAAMDELSAYFARLVEHRRRHPADDLVTLLASVHDGDPDRLSHGELMGNMMVLLTAGFETTSFLISHGVMLALEHPGHAARLRAGEPQAAERYTEEILRYEPPVHVTSRWAVADTELLGEPVPAGTKVVLILAAANRDPGRFDNPARFDPDRTPEQPLSFGAGGHFCLGAPLARLEARIALPALLRRFGRITAVGAPVYRDRWVVRGLDTFALTVGT